MSIEQNVTFGYKLCASSFRLYEIKFSLEGRLKKAPRVDISLIPYFRENVLDALIAEARQIMASYDELPPRYSGIELVNDTVTEMRTTMDAIEQLYGEIDECLKILEGQEAKNNR